MDTGCSPERVLKAHSTDKVAHLFGNLRSAPEATGLPPPVSREALSVPTHDRFRPNDSHGSKDVRKAPIEPNEQSAIGPAQIQPTWRTLSKHVQLMSQRQNFGLKLATRLETIAEHASKKQGNCGHPAIMF